ncbi:hypothetical protein C7S16_2403 [Burkholderia thailandensis]|uniref:Uncharacterized protein n=1 Tax=Burkholderia thailandensis TaxID=57975 RepID=A0AAW9D2H7_BURTH|nr:hypothetical protein [Burkholderia thailandensis]
MRPGGQRAQHRPLEFVKLVKHASSRWENGARRRRGASRRAV